METFSALLALCAGKSHVNGEFPSQRPVTRSFDVSLIFGLNKRLSKPSWSWWFETPSRLLWSHCNDTTFFISNRALGPHFTNGFPSQFRLDRNFVLLSPRLSQSDRYKILCMALQLCCRGVCKICCDLMASCGITARGSWQMTDILLWYNDLIGDGKEKGKIKLCLLYRSYFFLLTHGVGPLNS